MLNPNLGGFIVDYYGTKDFSRRHYKVTEERKKDFILHPILISEFDTCPLSSSRVLVKATPPPENLRMSIVK